MEQIEIKEGEFLCLYCGKNIIDMDYKCDCPDAVKKREFIASIPKYKYDIKHIDGKIYAVEKI